MMSDQNLNGSVDLLADAMRKVFAEAVEGAVSPLGGKIDALSGDIDSMRGEMATKTDIETTNKNMQAQFSEQEKTIGKLIRDRQPRTKSPRTRASA